MKSFLIFIVILFNLSTASNAMIQEEVTNESDEALARAAHEADMMAISSLLDNQVTRNGMTGNGVAAALSVLIRSAKLTEQDRLAMIEKILSTKVPERMSVPQVCKIFDIATSYGPSSTVQAMLDNLWIYENIDKKTVRWSLENHDRLEIISKDPTKRNLVEKDSSNFLNVMLRYQRILDFIDRETAKRIFLNTMNHPNAKVIKLLFAHPVMLEKAGYENVHYCATMLGLIKDSSVVKELIEDKNFTCYLSQEDWNNCYRGACLLSYEDVAKLLKPRTSWCTLF